MNEAESEALLHILAELPRSRGLGLPSSTMTCRLIMRLCNRLHRPGLGADDRRGDGRGCQEKSGSDRGLSRLGSIPCLSQSNWASCAGAIRAVCTTFPCPGARRGIDCHPWRRPVALGVILDAQVHRRSAEGIRRNDPARRPGRYLGQARADGPRLGMSPWCRKPATCSQTLHGRRKTLHWARYIHRGGTVEVESTREKDARSYFPRLRERARQAAGTCRAASSRCW